MLGNQDECREFWKEFHNGFKDAVESIKVNEADALIDVILEEKNGDDCRSPSVGSVNWKELTEKLKNLDKATQAVKEKEELQTQLSGSQQNTVMASTLGPASGVGAGLSLFPLLAKFLKR